MTGVTAAGADPGCGAARSRRSPPGDPPLAILVDYDGTIALTDVTDTVMAEHVPGGWEEVAALYDAGPDRARAGS